MTFESFPSSTHRKEGLHKSLTPALVLALSTNIALAHEQAGDVSDFEIPPGVSWEQGLDLAKVRTTKEGDETEVPMNYFVFADGKAFWNVPHIKYASEDKIKTDNLHQQVLDTAQLEYAGEYSKICIMHTHSMGLSYYPYLPPSVGNLGENGGGDIIFLRDMRTQLQKLEGGQEVAEKMTHAVLASEGIYYYDVLSDVRSQVLREERAQKAEMDFRSERSGLFEEMSTWLRARVSGLSIADTLALYDHVVFRGFVPAEDFVEGDIEIDAKKKAIEDIFMHSFIDSDKAMLLYGSEDYKTHMKYYHEDRKQHAYSYRPAFEKVGYADTFNMFFDMTQDVHAWRMDVAKEFQTKPNPVDRSIDMERLQEIYREYGYDMRFVPTRFVKEEPPCAGVEYDVEYMYNNGEWEMQITK